MFVTWFSSQFENGEAALEWARDNGAETIDTPAINLQASARGWSDLTKINMQMQVALVSLCRDEALIVVRNSARGQGLDA